MIFSYSFKHISWVMTHKLWLVILKTHYSEWLEYLLRNQILLNLKYKVIKNDFIVNWFKMLSPSPCCSCFKWRKFFQYCVDWWCPRRCCCFNCCFCLLSRKASLNDYYTCALICCTVAFWKDPSQINFSTGSCTLKMVNQYAVSRNMWLNPSSASI